MYCRFCGQLIQSDSEFCPCCGKKLSSRLSHKKLDIADRNNETIFYSTNETFQRVTKVFCLIAVLFFLIFFIKIAPGFGFKKVIWYIIGALITLFSALLFVVKSNKSDSKFLYITTFIISIFIMVMAVSLRITYEAKVDAALADIPNSGVAHVKFSFTDEYYNSSGEGYIHEPTSYISINGDEIYDNYSKIKEINLNNDINIKGYAKYYFSQQHYDGNGETFIKFNKDNLKDGHSFDIEFITGGDHTCIITVKATYVMDFWQVIMHK